jgi:hypothetical protein
MCSQAVNFFGKLSSRFSQPIIEFFLSELQLAVQMTKKHLLQDSLRGVLRPWHLRGLESSDANQLRNEDVMHAAALSHAAYSSPNDVSSVNHNFIYQEKTEELYGLTKLVEASRTLFVSFRGSTNLQDFVNNLDFRLVPLDTPQSKVRIHAGFHRRFRLIEASLKEAVHAQSDRFDRIIVTGHSLGGALASIASVYLANMVQKNVYCVSFGSPRVGNREFVDLFRKSVSGSRRFVNSGDPVPSIPMEAFYEHATPAIVLTELKSQLERSEVFGIDRIREAILNLELDKIRVNHDIQAYIKRLSSL